MTDTVVQVGERRLTIAPHGSHYHVYGGDDVGDIPRSGQTVLDEVAYYVKTAMGLCTVLPECSRQAEVKLTLTIPPDVLQLLPTEVRLETLPSMVSQACAACVMHVQLAVIELSEELDIEDGAVDVGLEPLRADR